MSIDKDGFLSKDIVEWIKKYRQAYQEWFDLSENSNRIAHSTMHNLQVNKQNAQQVLSATLFVRILGFYQASIILAERGMINESKVILRSMLNATFIICTIANSEEVMSEYFNDDFHHRIKSLRKIEENPHLFEKELYKEVQKEVSVLLNQLLQERVESKPKEITVRYLAEKANMMDFYNTVYSYFSETEHSSARDLEQYLVVNGEKEIKGIKWGPSVVGIDMLLLTGIENLIHATNSIEKIFELEQSKMQDISKKIVALSKNISGDMNIV